MLKRLLAEWLEERRSSNRPPLPQDATIYIMAFVEWADKRASLESNSAAEFDRIHETGKRLKSIFARDGIKYDVGTEDYIVRAVEEAAQHQMQRTALEPWQIEALEEGARLMEKRRNEK